MNPNAPDRIEQKGIAYATGDKVMQIENDYEREIYNGDIGRLTEIDRAQKQLTVTIDGRDLIYGFDELDSLIPAYAITVHKAQGSEYPVVILPLARSKVGCSGAIWSTRRLPGRSAWSSYSRNRGSGNCDRTTSGNETLVAAPPTVIRLRGATQEVAPH